MRTQRLLIVILLVVAGVWAFREPPSPVLDTDEGPTTMGDTRGLAVELGYLAEAEVVSALEQRPSNLDVILTGPSMPTALLAMADQVTQLRRGF